MANYKRKLVALAASAALAVGVTGATIAAASTDDGAKANGLRIVQKANGL